MVIIIDSINTTMQLSFFFLSFFSAVIGPLLDEGLRMTFSLCPVLCFPDPVRSGHLSDVVHPPCLLSSFSSYSVSGIPIGHTLRPTSIVLTCHMPGPTPFQSCFNPFQSAKLLLIKCFINERTTDRNDLVAFKEVKFPPEFLKINRLSGK